MFASISVTKLVYCELKIYTDKQRHLQFQVYCDTAHFTQLSVILKKNKTQLIKVGLLFPPFSKPVEIIQYSSKRLSPLHIKTNFSIKYHILCCWVFFFYIVIQYCLMELFY